MNGDAFKAWRDAPQKPLVMGILNITPDSFSDGGRFLARDAALLHAEKMCAEGADIIDIGAESTRPGATPLACQEELDRLLPIIEAIRQNSDVLISVDTYKPQVMQAAVETGAGLINDIFSLQKPGAIETVAALDVPIMLMHMKGEPCTMQDNLDKSIDICKAVHDFFEERISACDKAGIDKNRLLLDVGFGFGKTVQHNLMLTKYLNRFTQYNIPLALGVSRKSTIGKVLDQPVDKRLAGGLALTVFAVQEGARIIRTHDVEETKHALMMLDGVLTADEYKFYK